MGPASAGDLALRESSHFEEHGTYDIYEMTLPSLGVAPESTYSLLRIDNDADSPYSPRKSGITRSRLETEVRRLLQMFLAVCGVFLVVSPPSAATTAPPTAGVVHVFATPSNGAGGHVVFTGAIGDYGTSLQMNGAGNPSSSGNIIKMTLHKGTFKVNLTALNQKSNNANPVVNPTTCSALLSVTAPVTLFDGAGLYKGISGSIDVTLTFALIAPKFTSGAHKGQCNLSNNGPLLAQWGSITGTGNVRFS